MFVVAVVLIALTGLAIGVWPAISVFRTGGSQGLRSTGTASPGARPRVRFALVTTQIALTLALLAGSALLLRSLWNVVSVPLGFEAEHVVTLSADQMSPAPQFDSTLDARFITGLSNVGDRMLIIMNMEALMGSADMGLLASVSG